MAANGSLLKRRIVEGSRKFPTTFLFSPSSRISQTPDLMIDSAGQNCPEWTITRVFMRELLGDFS